MQPEAGNVRPCPAVPDAPVNEETRLAPKAQAEDTAAAAPVPEAAAEPGAPQAPPKDSAEPQREPEDAENTDTENEDETPKARHSWKKNLTEWMVALLIALLVALIITQVIFVNAHIPSESMLDTIRVGDRVIGFRLAYVIDNPQRGDIVIFHYPDDETQLYVKRVIGMPGETLEIRNGRVYIDDSPYPLEEEYVYGEPKGDYGPYEIPENAYFMMGDNRASSWDSRYWNQSFVMRDKIVGEAIFRLFPNPGPLA